jgi:hypothetical protein
MLLDHKGRELRRTLGLVSELRIERIKPSERLEGCVSYTYQAYSDYAPLEEDKSNLDRRTK